MDSETAGAARTRQTLVQGATVYVLNEQGVNRWSALVQPGRDDAGARVTEEECAAVARALAQGVDEVHRVVETIAREWDLCLYMDAPGGSIDIGDAIRATAVKAMGRPAWMPIASAPRCGRRFLVRDSDHQVAVVNHPPGCALGEWTFMAGRWAGSSVKWIEPVEWCEIPV